jgi:hypothetical protein
MANDLNTYLRYLEFFVLFLEEFAMTPFFTQREVAEMIGTTQARINYAIKTGRYRPAYYREHSHRFLTGEDAEALAKLFRLPVPGVLEVKK